MSSNLLHLWRKPTMNLLALEVVKTIGEVKKRQAKNTQEACYLYSSFCEQCHQKRARKVPKGLVVELVRNHNVFKMPNRFNQLSKITWWWFQIQYGIGEPWYKFCVLGPLTTKRADEVATILLDIFLTFGASAILQSDNGREFFYADSAELSTPWPKLKLVTGFPPPSSKPVCCWNGDIQDILVIWMQ